VAKASVKLIQALKRTAAKLKSGAPYQWGHMGCCNCGNLAQVLTQLSKTEIHAYALEKNGDWREQCNDYCRSSGYHVDQIIKIMFDHGLTHKDLENLERLSDEKVRKAMPKEIIHHNQRDDVILYLTTWAQLLEEELVDNISIKDLEELNRKSSSKQSMSEKL